jgi:hypothetical protein
MELVYAWIPKLFSATKMLNMFYPSRMRATWTAQLLIRYLTPLSSWVKGCELLGIVKCRVFSSTEIIKPQHIHVSSTVAQSTR